MKFIVWSAIYITLIFIKWTYRSAIVSGVMGHSLASRQRTIITELYIYIYKKKQIWAHKTQIDDQQTNISAK